MTPCLGKFIETGENMLIFRRRYKSKRISRKVIDDVQSVIATLRTSFELTTICKTYLTSEPKMISVLLESKVFSSLP